MPNPMGLGAVNHKSCTADLIEMTSKRPTPGAGVGGRHHVASAIRGTSQVCRDLSRRYRASCPLHGGKTGGGPFLVLERFTARFAIVTVVASRIFSRDRLMLVATARRRLASSPHRVRRAASASVRAKALSSLWQGLLGSALRVFQAVQRVLSMRYDTALVFVRITPLIALRSVVLSVPLGVLAVVVSSWTLLRGGMLRR